VKILYLMGRLPRPLSSGDAIRNWYLLEAAAETADAVDVVTLQAPNSTDADVRSVAALARELIVVEALNTDYLGTLRNRVSAVLTRSYYDGIGRDQLIQHIVTELIDRVRYDVIVLSQIYMASAIPREALSRTVYDSHNVHGKKLTESFGAANRLLRGMGSLVARKVSAQERFVLREARTTIACSVADERAFRDLDPEARTEVIENGALLDTAPRRELSKCGRLLFFASLDYRSNVDALRFFIEDVVPHLDGSIEVVVAGSNASPAALQVISAAGTRIDYRGYVEDAKALVASATVVIVPLLTGGGTRLKVLEAMGSGIPIVSTSKGVEGIPVTHGHHALIADTPLGLASAVSLLMRDVSVWDRISEGSMELVREHYSWDLLKSRFVSVLRSGEGSNA
jgi:polysaccharide biosynthesis protein PslH